MLLTNEVENHLCREACAGDRVRGCRTYLYALSIESQARDAAVGDHLERRQSQSAPLLTSLRSPIRVLGEPM